MIVVFADKIPPAVRGKMKLWFIEPTPMVFVSGVNDALAEAIVERLLESCDPDANILMVRSTSVAPGYKLIQKNSVAQLTEITNMQLVKKV